MTDKQIKEVFKNGFYCIEPCPEIKELLAKLKCKEQAEQKLVNQIQILCDFINSRPETFKGINGSVDKIITDYAKAKEQECERLKEEVSLLKESNSKLQSIEDVVSLKKWYLQQLDQLKAENETLKQYKASKQASYESMQREWNQAVNKNRELKQTLTEIKEIAEEKAKVNDWLALDILQKINEVENGKSNN